MFTLKDYNMRIKKTTLHTDHPKSLSIMISIIIKIKDEYLPSNVLKSFDVYIYMYIYIYIYVYIYIYIHIYIYVYYPAMSSNPL
jgi:hypothetical protein